MNTIAVFKSRSHALAVYNYLRTKKIACITINTPSRFHLGCGISIVFDSTKINDLKMAIEVTGASSFIGFFSK